MSFIEENKNNLKNYNSLENNSFLKNYKELENLEIRKIKSFEQNKEKLNQVISSNWKLTIETIKKEDKNFPEKLKNIYSCPKQLYIIGNKELLNDKSIAIIGCRDCTKQGAYNAYKFSYELAKKNICIISRFSKRN